MTAERLTNPFRWLGSKVRMRKRILSILEDVPRELYVEPFGGSGAIFFGKESEQSVYNDKNRLLSNFFMTLKNEETRREIRELATLTPIDSETFYRLRSILQTFLKGEKDEESFFSLYSSKYQYSTTLAFALFYVQNFAFAAVPNGPWGGGRLRKHINGILTILMNSRRN